MFSSDRNVILVEIRDSYALAQQALDIVLRLRRSSRNYSHICGWLGQQSRGKQSKKSTQSVFLLFFFHHDRRHSLCKDSFGTDRNGNIFDPNLGTNWTNSDEILASVATVNSFDPNSKTGPTVSPTD
jgi:hypothetical protein